MSDSGKALEASRSTAVPLSEPLSKFLPNQRTRDLRHSLFSSDEEYGGGYYYSSPHPTRASLHERVDDGASRRHFDKTVVPTLVPR